MTCNPIRAITGITNTDNTRWMKAIEGEKRVGADVQGEWRVCEVQIENITWLMSIYHRLGQ
jgi:hypothetical protein